MSFIGSGRKYVGQTYIGQSPINEADDWSKYPAVQNVNFNEFDITNVRNLSVENITAQEKVVDNLTVNNNATVSNTLNVGEDISCERIRVPRSIAGQGIATIGGSIELGTDPLVNGNIKSVGSTITYFSGQSGELRIGKNSPFVGTTIKYDGTGGDQGENGEIILRSTGGTITHDFSPTSTIVNVQTTINNDFEVNGDSIFTGQISNNDGITTNGNMVVGQQSFLHDTDIIGNVSVSGEVQIVEDLIVNGDILANNPDKRIAGGDDGTVNTNLRLSSGKNDESNILIYNSRGLAQSYISFTTRDTGGTGTITEKMRIIKNGNVGIGTSSPTSKLEVDGDITIDGANNLRLTTGGSPAIGAEINSRIFLMTGSVSQGLLKVGTSTNSSQIHIQAPPVDTPIITSDYTVNVYGISTTRAITLNSGGTLLTLNIYDNNDTTGNFTSSAVEHTFAIKVIGGSWTGRIQLLSSIGLPSSQEFMYFDNIVGTKGTAPTYNFSISSPTPSLRLVKVKGVGDATNSNIYYTVEIF